MTFSRVLLMALQKLEFGLAWMQIPCKPQHHCDRLWLRAPLVPMNFDLEVRYDFLIVKDSDYRIQVLTTGRFWWTQASAPKRGFEFSGALLRFHSFALRLINLLSVTGSAVIEDHWSFWSILVDSDYAPFWASIFLRLVFGHTVTKTTHPTQLILVGNRRLQFQSKLSVRLSSQQNDQSPSDHWERIKEALYSVATVAKNFGSSSLRNDENSRSVTPTDAHGSSIG